MKLEEYLDKCQKGMGIIHENAQRHVMTVQEKIDFETLRYAYNLEKEHDYLIEDYWRCKDALRFLIVLAEIDEDHPFKLDEDGKPDLNELFKKYKL